MNFDLILAKLKKRYAVAFLSASAGAGGRFGVGQVLQEPVEPIRPAEVNVVVETVDGRRIGTWSTMNETEYTIVIPAIPTLETDF